MSKKNINDDPRNSIHQAKALHLLQNKIDAVNTSFQPNQTTSNLMTVYKTGLTIGAIALAAAAAPEFLTVAAATATTGFLAQTLANKADNQIIAYLPGIVNATSLTNQAVNVGSQLSLGVLQNAPYTIANLSQKRKRNEYEDILNENLLDSSYESLDKAKLRMSKFGYKLDSSLSTEENKVFVDEFNNATITHRGSTGYFWDKDWKNNAKIAFGFGIKNNERYDRVVKITNQAEKKYGKTTAIGHSQGGYYAEKAPNKGKTITFNKAAGINDLFISLPANQTDYRNRGDAISFVGLLGQHGSKKYTNSYSFNPLKAHSYKLN